MTERPQSRAPRPAWVEIDLDQLQRNFAIINAAKPRGLRFMAVVKDEAYGHGALAVARVALASGAAMLGVSTVGEAVALREQGITAPVMLLGDREETELPWCCEHNLTCCVSDGNTVARLGELASRVGRRVPVHVKLNTGMNRYGVRWDAALPLVEQILATPSLALEGVLSHFAQSDETDKTFALAQLARFNQTLAQLAARGVSAPLRHLCNSGGFLDLPQAHFDMVRLGILPLGVYPSAVCRRLEGLVPAMTVKARVVAIQSLAPGDTVGYGMRYTASSPRRIGVVPLGYGDGFPRVRNAGAVLVRGRRAPIIGGVAMDALSVDLTDIPEARLGDEVVLMGRQGAEEITAHDIARLKNSVSYDILAGWRARLPRIFVGATAIA